MKLTSEAPLVSVLPLPVDDLEGDVLVGRARTHSHDAVLAPLHRQQLEHGRGALVDQIRVEDVELVALDNLARRVVKVVVGLVVLVLP